MTELRKQVVSVEPWAKKIGLTEVHMVHELNKRAPDIMRKSVVVVDAIRDTAEGIVEALTGCFAAGAGGLPELGLGNAERDVVLSAWRLQMSLHENAARQRLRADLMT